MAGRRPAAHARSTEGDKVIREPELESRQRHGREPVRILLLEDDPQFAELVRAQLRRMPWGESRLEVAGTLAHALAKLASDSFGLVVTDVNVPDSSGLPTIEALARAGEQPIIVLTGDQDPALRAGAMHAGAYEVLSKDGLSAAALERLVRLASIQANTSRLLRDSEERFTSLAWLSTDWYWEQDEELRFTRFEGRTHEISGNDPEQAIGKQRWEIPTITPISCTWEQHRAALEARKPFRDFEYTRIGDDGILRFISVTGEPWYDGEGRFRGYRGRAADITQKKRAEAAIHESEARFRRTFELAASGMAHIGMDRRFVRVNRRLCEILGYPEEELLQLTGRQISHPDDLDVINEQRPRLYAGEIDAVRIEKRYLRKDRSVVWVKVTITVERDAAGKPLYEIAVYDDITAQRGAEARLRESEARFRSLTELSADIYWETDAQHRMLRTTHGASHRPISARGAQIGKTRWEIPSTRPDAAGWAAHRATLDAHLTFRDFELARIDAEGVERHLSISGEPMLDASGAFIGYRGVGKEITARKREQMVLQLEHSVALFLAEADEVATGLKEVIRHFCETQNWWGGRYWHADEQSGALRFGAGWAPPGSAVEQYNEEVRNVAYRAGEGYVGRVWQSGEPLWIADIQKDGRALRKYLAPGVLKRSTFLFPVAARGKTAGVIAFDNDKVREPDERLLQAVRVIGSQIGQFLRRKQGEEALRESEARFRSLTELSADWYWQQDEHFRFMRLAGPGAAAMARSGDPQVYVGKARWEIPDLEPFHGDWSAHRAQLERHEAFRDAVFRRRMDNGTLRYMSVSGEPVFDAAGGFTGYRGVGRDVTEKVAAEEALRKSARTLELAQQVADVGSWELEFEGSAELRRKSLRWSDQCFRIFGHEPGSVDITSDLFFDRVHPDDRQKVRERISETMRSGVRYELEHRIVRPDGAERVVEEIGIAERNAGGQPWRILGTTRDITVRKREEALLRLEHEVTRCLADALAGGEGLQAVMRAICETQGWSCGRYFAADDESGVLRFAQAWGVRTAAVEHLIAKSRDLVYARGQGLSGSVWQSGEPLWVRDVSKDPRASGSPHAALQGGAFVFPVTSGERTIGVLSFSSADAREPDARLLQAVRVIGSQVGQFLMRKKAERKQRRRAEDLQRFRAAMDMSLDAIYLTDRAAMRFLDVNKVGCKALGYTREELLNMGPQDVPPSSKEQLEREYDAVIAEGSRSIRVESSYVAKDGRMGWTELHRRALRSGEKWIIVTIARDITERKLAEQRQAAHLRYQERIARFGQSALAKREPAELIEQSVQAMLEALAADAVAYFEPGPAQSQLVLRAVVGVADAHASCGAISCRRDNPVLQVLVSGNRLLVDGANLEAKWAHSLRSTALIPVRGETAVRGVLCVAHRQPGAFAAEALNFVDAAASVLSTALQRIDSEGQLAYLAQFDALTGLPNRALLADRFSQMIVQAKRRGSPLAVLFVDLDGFKMVNDSLGHAGGDALLKETAVRLQSTVRTGDTVARISGDEFAVVLADLARPDDAALVAQKIIDRLSAAVEVHGKEVFVTASVGIAAFPADGADAETLIGAADAAMYRAKQSGRNAYQFFTADINQRSRARAQMGTELRRALEREEFALVYQPKYTLEQRQLKGAEALLRWKHPERGVISPMEFIPVLEETGLIVPVGEWVLRRACADLKAWQSAGLAVGPVAVNLSARQFRQPDLHQRIKAIVGADPSLIELEITESQLMQDPDHAIRVMRALCDAGIRIAIDDFGTGYSSLSYLRRFPVGALKIDRSFVKDMSSEKGDATIVRAIIEMGRALGFVVIAEGVETEDQANFLRLLRCDQAQGYLFAKPMPMAEFAALIARESSS